MMFIGKVVGGHYINATIDTNRKGELALSLPLRKTPNLTSQSVTSWEEVFPEALGGAAGAVKMVGQAVARTALPGALGKAASAAVGSTVDAVTGAMHTVRVDWIDGKQSLVQLPDKLFQHLAILLKERRVQDTNPTAATTSTEHSGVIGQLAQFARVLPREKVDVTEQIAKLASLRDQGALTEAEFAAKKAELLGRI